MQKDKRPSFHYFGTDAGKCPSYTETKASQIDPADIAVSLSRQARGIGHDPASVAQHSLVATYFMFDRAEALPAAQRPLAPLYTLLHDAAEAYTGDLPLPLKTTLRDLWHACVVETALNAVKDYHERMHAVALPADVEAQVVEDIEARLAVQVFDPFAQIEGNLNRAIQQAFGLPAPSNEMRKLIKSCDKDAIALEMRDVMSSARRGTFLASGYTFPEPHPDIFMRPLGNQHLVQQDFGQAMTLLKKVAKSTPKQYQLRVPELKK